MGFTSDFEALTLYSDGNRNPLQTGRARFPSHKDHCKDQFQKGSSTGNGSERVGVYYDLTVPSKIQVLKLTGQCDESDAFKI